MKRLARTLWRCVWRREMVLTIFVAVVGLLAWQTVVAERDAVHANHTLQAFQRSVCHYYVGSVRQDETRLDATRAVIASLGVFRESAAQARAAGARRAMSRALAQIDARAALAYRKQNRALAAKLRGLGNVGAPSACPTQPPR